MSGVNTDHLARFDRRLHMLLDAEVAAGNEVASTLEWAYGKVEILVCMRDPYRVKPAALAEGVEFEESRDHWVSSGVLMDYQCRVPGPGNVNVDAEFLHVLRSVRPG